MDNQTKPRPGQNYVLRLSSEELQRLEHTVLASNNKLNKAQILRYCMECGLPRLQAELKEGKILLT